MKGWRSVTFFVLSALAYAFAWPELSQVLDPKYIAIGTSVVGFILRLITNTKVGSPN